MDTEHRSSGAERRAAFLVAKERIGNSTKARRRKRTLSTQTRPATPPATPPAISPPIVTFIELPNGEFIDERLLNSCRTVKFEDSTSSAESSFAEREQAPREESSSPSPLSTEDESLAVEARSSGAANPDSTVGGPFPGSSSETSRVDTGENVSSTEGLSVLLKKWMAGEGRKVRKLERTVDKLKPKRARLIQLKKQKEEQRITYRQQRQEERNWNEFCSSELRRQLHDKSFRVPYFRRSF